MEGSTSEDRFLRLRRTEPLTMNEVRLLGFILTREEWSAVMELQDPQWLEQARPTVQREAEGGTVH
jgi:hypothetical protein